MGLLKALNKKKHYITITENGKKTYLCDDESWVVDKRFALGIVNPAVAEVACKQLNEQLTGPPYCVVVFE